MSRSLPLAILATIDPLLRDAAVVSLLLDSPTTAALRYDILEDGGAGTIRRTLLDGTGAVEDVELPLEHACLSCAVREDAIPRLRDLARDGRWDAVLLALPVSAESAPVARTLAPATMPGGQLSGLRLSAVVTAVDADTVEANLLGDDLLTERGLGLASGDRRAVGEALAAQLTHADVVAVSGDTVAHPVGSDLIEHVRAHDGARVDGLHHLQHATVFGGRHDAAEGEARTDPRLVRASHGPTGAGVWTLDLRSERPFHPDRLLRRIEDLGAVPVRARGVFWVPSRPDSAYVWDGAGGQVGIGVVGPWDGRSPRTHLVVTGCGDEARGITRAFDDALLTEVEWNRGLASWLGRDDVLAPWLGDRRAA